MYIYYCYDIATVPADESGVNVPVNALGNSPDWQVILTVTPFSSPKAAPVPPYIEETVANICWFAKSSSSAYSLEQPTT